LGLGVVVAVAVVLNGCSKNKEGDDSGKKETGYSPAEARARWQTCADLQILAVTMNIYRDNNSHFPPADGSSDPAEPKLAGLSWRTYLLPRMEDDRNKIQGRNVYFNLLRGKYPLAKGAEASEVWNRPGLKTIALHPFVSPIDGKTKAPWYTFNRVFIGKGAAFERKKLLTHKDFSDGLENTIMVVEAGEAVPWPKPAELEYKPDKPLPKLGGLFPDGFYAAFGDGSVRFIRKDTDEKTIRALITRNGGEKIETLPPKVDMKALYRAAGPEK
jgi:hypothetical protein